MARHRTHSIEFKRQIAQDFIAGETLHTLASRHDISRNLIRIWVRKFKAGAFDDDAQAADLLQQYEAKIAAIEQRGRHLGITEDARPFTEGEVRGDDD
jgi:transposase